MSNEVFEKMSNPSKTLKLVFFGSPLLDISAHCQKDLLDKYLLKEDDCIRATESHESLFLQLFKDQESHLSSGGSAQNAARIAKWVLKGRGDVAFAGCTGQDDFEAWMRRQLTSEGVKPLYVHIPDQSTGVCACLLSCEEKRSMVAKLGAGAVFAPEHLLVEPVKHGLAGTRCFFVEGYFLGHSPQAVMALIEVVKEQKSLFALSLSAEYVCEKHLESLLRVMPYVDVLFGNEAEVKTLAKAMGHNATVNDAIQSLRQIPNHRPSSNRIVIVTRGSEPVILDDGSSPIRLKTYNVKTTDIKIVDSVGCGDALAGAFLAVYLATDGDVDMATKAGICAAAEIVQVRGCDPPVKLELMKEMGL